MDPYNTADVFVPRLIGCAHKSVSLTTDSAFFWCHKCGITLRSEEIQRMTVDFNARRPKGDVVKIRLSAVERR